MSYFLDNIIHDSEGLDSQEQINSTKEISLEDVKSIIASHTNLIFNNVLMKSLFGEFKYSDLGIYEKCEKDLLKFLKSYGYTYRDGDKTELKSIFRNSSAYGLYANRLKENLNFFSRYHRKYDWASIPNMIKDIVNISIIESKPINVHFARILIGRDYVKENFRVNFTVPELKKLYRNLISTISDIEFCSWVINETNSFENIVSKCKGRIQLCNCTISNDNLFVEELILSSVFSQLAKDYPNLETDAANSIYSSIYKKIYNKSSHSLPSVTLGSDEDTLLKPHTENHIQNHIENHQGKEMHSQQTTDIESKNAKIKPGEFITEQSNSTFQDAQQNEYKPCSTISRDSKKGQENETKAALDDFLRFFSGKETDEFNSISCFLNDCNELLRSNKK